MPLAAGVRLGPYEIVTLIGTGGMSEVYRARDPRLGRDVAAKVLPSAFAADTDRLRRFEQEARAAALNHPNILAVHDIDTHASTDSGQMSLYIVSELLEGNTLGDLPARRSYAGAQGNPIRRAHRGRIGRGARQGHRSP